jgi:hypothetical protein
MPSAPADPTVDESFARLHQAGWSMGETATEGVGEPGRRNDTGPPLPAPCSLG